MKSPNPFIIRNINLMGAFAALSVLESGNRVHFQLNDSNLAQKHIELSSMFRWNMLELPGTLTELKNWNRIANLFPYLFYPQRVADISPEREINPKKLIVLDQLQGKDRENCSLPIRFDSPGFEALNPRFCSKGVLNREYLIDRNRLTSILLAQCCTLGATFSHNETEPAHLICETNNAAQKLIELRDCTFPYNNSIRIASKWGSISWISKASSVWILINLHPKHEPNLKTEILEQASDLGIQINDFQKNAIHLSCIEEFEITKEKITSLPQLSLNDTLIGLPKFLKKLEKTSKLKLRLPRMLEVETKFSLAGFDLLKQILNECDRMFDLAKQTGLNYSTFQQLFYSYGSEAMDWMIEEAFEQMNKSRDAERIWNDTERLWNMNFEPFKKLD